MKLKECVSQISDEVTRANKFSDSLSSASRSFLAQPQRNCAQNLKRGAQRAEMTGMDYND